MQEQPAEKIRVLIVEEAAVFGVETQTTLQKMGYDVLPPVADTEGALRCISKTRPDIVLMGIVIKGANNGIETAQSIREKFDVPVVFIATNSDKAIIEKIKSAGPYGYLIKPFNKDILFNTIELVAHKHRSERSLHNSENQYRQLIDTLQEGIWVIDKDAYTTFANPKMARMLGYTVSEMAGRHLFEFMDEQGREIAKYYLKRRAQGIREQHDFEFLKKDGARMYASLETSPLMDEEGRYTGAIAGIIDTTEKRHALDALKKSEEKYRAIFENAIEGVFQSTPDGRLVTVNPSCSRMFGFDTPDEMIASVKDIEQQLYINQGDRTKIKKILSRGGIIKGFETRFSRKDGSIALISINARAVFNPDGKIMYYEGTSEDITERKRIEKALQESEERYRMSIEHSNDGVAIVQGTKHVHVNRKLLDIYGYEHPGDLTGKPVSKIIHPDDKNKVRRYNRLRQEGKRVPDRYEMKGIRKDGTTIYLEVSAARIIYREKPASLIFIRDIMVRKKAEVELKNLNERLRALTDHIQSIREQERTHIAREIHDELGQALTAIKMDLAWFKKKVPENDTVLPWRIESSIKLVDETIKVVRRISTELRPGILDDLGLVPAIEWQLGDFQNRTGIKCMFHATPKHLKLSKEHSTALFRILQESLTNVARHSGTPMVEVRLQKTTHATTMTISDHGRGISEKEIYDNNSLGIMGMRERVHLLQGQFSISGMSDRGTTITCTLPIGTKNISRQKDR